MLGGTPSSEGLLRGAAAKKKVCFREEPKEATPESLQKKIDEIGFGPAQLLAVFCCGGIMASEGSEVLIMGSITTLLTDAWHLGAFLRAFMTSIVFVGFSIGNLLAGYVGDTFGRRPAIMIAYAIVFVAGLLTSFTNNPAAMMSIRIFVGFGCGIGFPSVYSLVPEVSPVHLRGVKSAVMISFMPFGEFWASLGVFLFDKDLTGTKPLGYASWRLLVQWSSIGPLLFFIASCFFLQESPHYLLHHGRIREMNEVLAKMAWLNGKSNEVDTTFIVEDAPEAAAASSKSKGKEVREFSWIMAVGKLLSDKWVGTTLFLFIAQFTKDFAYFGLGYVFPQYFEDTAGKLSVGMQMMIISFLALPGVALASILSKIPYIGNILSLSLVAALQGLCSFGMLDFINWSWLAYFVKIFSMAYFILCVLYTAEVFPTRIRTTAVGLCSSFGRLGSISSPIVFELLKMVTDSFSPWWFTLMMFSFIVAVFAPIVLTQETKGKALAEEEEDEEDEWDARKPVRGTRQSGTQYSTA